MRFSDCAAFSFALLPLAACATPLHDDGNADNAGSSDASAPPPVEKGCLPFHNLAHVQSISGAVRSVATNGSVLVVVDDATVDGVDVPSLSIAVPALASMDDCLAGASIPSAPASALSPSSASPMSAVALRSGPWLFYSVAFGGVGVAPRDLTNGLFSSTGSFLFTADRPPYGTASIVDGDAVYAYGCVAARFLDADCYVARVPANSISDESQYSFYTGSGHWSPRVDDAWATTTGAASLDVAFVAGRYLMIYVQPLGTVIRARYGITPEGPWSAPVDLATCDLADADMFCAGIHAHQNLTSAPGTLAISYSITSLASDAAMRRVQNPDAWWPRLVALPIPPAD